MNKEEYYYRSIFEEYFPSESAARSVPSVPSVACSTAEALAWDEAFKNMNEPSGRAVAGVHEEHTPKTDASHRGKVNECPQWFHVGAGFARLYAPTWMYSGRQTLPTWFIADIQ